MELEGASYDGGIMQCNVKLNLVRAACAQDIYNYITCRVFRVNIYHRA